MKKIICYGDSNTFGFNPLNKTRYDENVRWSGLLGIFLKNQFEIIEQGANNRTGFVDNFSGEFYSAQKHFPKMLNEYDDIEILILAIGTNDLQFIYNLNFNEIEKGLRNLLNIAKTKVKNIILIPPVEISENILNSYFKIQFDENSIKKSKNVLNIYQKLADEFKCHLFNFNSFTKPSLADGLHYDINSHKIIAQKLYEFICNNYI